VAQLGAAFLSNEAEILDGIRFENSAAYLASWISKFENVPRMIVSAASQAQRATDFIMGIEHKESHQECQTSPEGMPLTFPALPTATRMATGFRPSWNGSTAPGRPTSSPGQTGNPRRYEKPERDPPHLGAPAP
jgi:hypothetical protein